MNLSKKQIVYLKDRGTLSVHKTLSDKLSLVPSESTRIKDANGNLSFGMDICRDGVQDYLAEEIFDPKLLSENQISGDTIIRVWRPPNVVFDPNAVKSHNGKSMTRNHPSVWVDDGNRSSLEKGVARDCWHNQQKRVISGTGIVIDPQMVAEIESGEFTEISDGYDSELDFEPGVVPESIDEYPCTDVGTEYDMIMRSYKPNHIAIVPEGRAGNARILDKGVKKMGFFEKIAKNRAIKEIKAMDRSTVLRMLADEETDEEKKAALEALAEDECGDNVGDECGLDSDNSEETDEYLTDAEADKVGVEEEFEIGDAFETGGIGPEGMIYGGVDTDFVEEFDVSGAETDESASKKNVLTPDGGINRVAHGITDSAGKPVEIIREFNVLISDSVSGSGQGTEHNLNKEVENMDAKELTALVTGVLKDEIPKMVDAAVSKRLGDGKDITLDDDDLGLEETEETEDMQVDEYIGDDEAEAIGIAEEWEEPDNNSGLDDEYISDEEAESIGVAEEWEDPIDEPEPEMQDELPETQGPTPEQFQKWAAGTTDPEAKRMFLALGEKIAGMDAEPEESVEPEPEETMDAGFIDMEGELEEDRLEAAAEGKPAPAGPPSNQVGDGDSAGEPVAEQNGYFVPKKLADSQGETAKLLLDTVKTVSSYGLSGIDVNRHAEDGTIYHRVIDAAGILKKGMISSPDGVTRERLEMAIGAIQKNRQMIDGMASLAGKVRDAQTSGGFNPGELY